MTDAVTNVANSTALSNAKSALGASASDKMGRDAFLKLLVAQLQNQDPLKPQDNAQFVAELAQFSNLEQTVGINERLDTLAMQNQGMQNSQIIGMVGQKATVRGSMVTNNGSGSPVPVHFTLEGNADKVSVTIKDLDGKAVRTIELGDRPAGVAQVSWDGRSNEGLVMPKGTYTVSVTAQTGTGGSVATSQETTGVIKSVAFDKGYPVLQLDNGVAVPVSDLLRVE